MLKAVKLGKNISSTRVGRLNIMEKEQMGE